MARDSIERKIYYYDIVATVLLDGTVFEANNQDGIIREAFRTIKNKYDEINSLEDENEKKFWIEDLEYNTDQGDKIYIVVDQIELTDNIKFKLVLCRQNAFPYIEKNGELSTIASFITGDFNIAEITHCVIFPESGVMGAEFNFAGARPSTIAKYIPHVFRSIAQLLCTAKLKSNVFRQIIEDDTYSLFELGVKNTPDMKRILRDDLGFIGCFFDDIEDVDTLEILIRRRKTKKKNGFDIPMDVQGIKEFVTNNREDISNFRVSQGIYKDAIDLLSDKLVCDKNFIYTENKTIDSNEMYASIVNYYDAVVSREN